MGGRESGSQQSHGKGEGVDFADYREYHPGEDLRYVDWNLYARLDLLYLKRFTRETELTLHVLLDVSRSMSLGDPSKLDMARKACAGLSYIGLRRNHRVGVGFFSTDLLEKIPPLKGQAHLTRICQSLAGATGAGTTDLNRSLEHYAGLGQDAGLRPYPAGIPRGTGMVIVVSDLFAPGGYEKGVRALLARGYQVGLLHLLSPEDSRPEVSGAYRLQDIETGEECLIEDTASFLETYRHRMEALCDEIKRFCRRGGVYYLQSSTAYPVDKILWDLVLEFRRGTKPWKF
jgi:uncharacterized protein (DUF58 family)